MVTWGVRAVVLTVVFLISAGLLFVLFVAM